jgi:hypothetical protein
VNVNITQQAHDIETTLNLGLDVDLTLVLGIKYIHIEFLFKDEVLRTVYRALTMPPRWRAYYGAGADPGIFKR